jgi:hypothetical protein
MPMLRSDTIHLRDHRVIDEWEGIALIGCAALVVVGAGLGLSRRRWGWLDCAAGAAAIGVVIYASTGSRLIVQGPGPGIEGAVSAVAGIGLLIAGLGGLVAIGAGLMLGLAQRSAAAEVPMPAELT